MRCETAVTFVNIRIKDMQQTLRITEPLRLGHLKEMLTPEDAVEPAAKKVRTESRSIVCIVRVSPGAL